MKKRTAPKWCSLDVSSTASFQNGGSQWHGGLHRSYKSRSALGNGVTEGLQQNCECKQFTQRLLSQSVLSLYRAFISPNSMIAKKGDPMRNSSKALWFSPSRRSLYMCQIFLRRGTCNAPIETL